jgi:uncharacterized membrane protein
MIGLTASVLYGLTAVCFKFLTSGRYLGGHAGWVLAGIGGGILLCGIFGAVVWPSGTITGTTWQASLWALPIGFFNGFGTLLVLWALQRPETNLSQLVPVYNTNTLIAFILAVILFRELPSGPDLIRNLAGAILIVVGTGLIGR